MMAIEISFLNGIVAIKPKAWDALTDGSPILSHAFLSALEETLCVGKGTGWQPFPMVAYDRGELVGVLPLYLKSHSYGEYVFDWAWANAYEQNGLAYYPKLLVAIPFTPITGLRLLSPDLQVQHLMVSALTQQIGQHALSSAHVLFPDNQHAEVLKAAGWLERNGVQFRWENEDFRDFDGFLSRLSHDKRKKIRQERKKVSAAGVTCHCLLGSEITKADWDFFYQCYENTYLEHRSTPYLTKDFFYLIGERLVNHILLIIAKQEGEPIAAAFNLFDSNTMYGRYWGATRFVSGLHFELCYYQAQEFCIQHQIQYFEGGAQGEHKLARGFRPRPTHSFHQIAHPDFERAIQDFLQRETHGVDEYHHELEQRAPFKS
jgi:hypothetical protein